MGLNLVDAAIMVTGCALGLGLGGLIGTVAGALAGTCVVSVGGIVLAARVAGFAFPWAAGLRIAAASAIMALALVVAATWPLAPAARIVVDIMLGAATYGFASAALFPALVRDLWRGAARARRPALPSPR